MIIGALILTIAGLLLTIMAGYLSANNLSPLPAMLGVIGYYSTCPGSWSWQGQYPGFARCYSGGR
ncbi:TPA: hypothetical protein MNC12_005565 [Klebsiella pneumoniae]|nr:hypothetical protein [Klebsiella pneumoniae]HBQ2115517.1 hypothetical protein [Klebsiella pneumoniae]HBU8409309.1 hypothetical protein [Klebsiella pneumoniae]HBW4728126.1 hypothetical protein [Klebsiella pneumoniae]HBW4796746.1 hypothetical protein [Klebsiella pneumoniae]